MERVKAYVDGFNLYHGLKDKHGRKYLWLDLQELPAVRSLKRVSTGKRIIAVFPPRRHSEDLRKATDGLVKINDVSLRNSQLPPTVVNAAGITLTRPKYWI